MVAAKNNEWKPFEIQMKRLYLWQRQREKLGEMREKALPANNSSFVSISSSAAIHFLAVFPMQRFICTKTRQWLAIVITAVDFKWFFTTLVRCNQFTFWWINFKINFYIVIIIQVDASDLHFKLFIFMKTRLFYFI